MSVYFVSRHQGAREWMAALQDQPGQPQIDYWVDHLEAAALQPGDLVVGTLPVSEIINIQARHARFKALVMDVPEALRGTELSQQQMVDCGAHLVDVQVESTAAPPAPRLDPDALAQRRALRREVRVVFVSDQVVPILLAALQFAPRTDAIVLLASQQKKETALRAQKLLQRELSVVSEFPAKVRVLQLDDDASDFPLLVSELDRILASYRKKHPSAVLVGDLTGGTKPMALALQQAMRHQSADGAQTYCSYTDTNADTFHWIAPIEPGEAMTIGLDARQLLAAADVRVASIASQESAFEAGVARRENFVKQHLLTLDDDQLAELNAWCAVADRRYKNRRVGQREEPLVIARQDLPATRSGATAASQLGQGFLDAAAKAGALNVIAGENGRLTAIQFTSHDWSEYLGGVWLEEWVWSQLRDLELDSNDMSVKIGRGKSVENELDLVVVHRNRMMLLECKTARMGQSPTGGGKEADTLYKLDSLGNAVSRLFGTRLLVSRQPMSLHAVERAHDSGIVLVCDRVSLIGESPKLGKRQRIKREYERARQLGIYSFAEFRPVVQQWMREGRIPMRRPRSFKADAPD